MPEQSQNETLPTPDGRLTGWKEIAAYLGRGVRTAQRWESEFGLPVRRMGTNRAESVFAFVEEIDQWLATASAARAHGAHPSDTPENGNDIGSGSQSDPPDGSESEQPAAVQTWSTQRLRIVAWTLGVIAVMLAGTILWRELGGGDRFLPDPGHSSPASLSIDVDTLVVRDDAGQLCWSHKFPVPLRELSQAVEGTDTVGGVLDVDGDGRREVWLGMFPVRTEDYQHRALWFFNEDGTPRWRYQYGGTARFGNVAFGPLWLTFRFIVTDNPDAPGGRAIWVVSRDSAEYPCVLQRLDVTTGKPLSEYWSNGWIGTVALVTWQEKRVLLVGAANNELRSSSLAVLDPLNPNGSAPAFNPKYRCTTCPAGGPLEFLVFPKPGRFNDSAGSGIVERIDVTSDNASMTVLSSHASGPSGASAVGIYRLDAGLRPLHVDVSDGYQPTYDWLVREGRIPPHTPAAVDPDRELLPILRWQNGAFVKVGKVVEK